MTEILTYILCVLQYNSDLMRDHIHKLMIDPNTEFKFSLGYENYPDDSCKRPYTIFDNYTSTSLTPLPIACAIIKFNNSTKCAYYSYFKSEEEQAELTTPSYCVFTTNKDISLSQNNDEYKNVKVGIFEIVGINKIIFSYNYENRLIKLILYFNNASQNLYLELSDVIINSTTINVRNIFGFNPKFFLSHENNVTFSK